MTTMLAERRTHQRPLRRLTRAMQWVAILSPSEARSAIIAHRQGDDRWGGSEAVVHYGGAAAVITNAIRLRHRTPQRQGAHQ